MHFSDKEIFYSFLLLKKDSDIYGSLLLWPKVSQLFIDTMDSLRSITEVCEGSGAGQESNEMHKV